VAGNRRAASSCSRSHSLQLASRDHWQEALRQIAADFLVNPLTVARAYRELGEYTETRRGIGLIVKEGVRDLLLRRDQKRFLRDEWPLIRERIKALDLDPKDLLK